MKTIEELSKEIRNAVIEEVAIKLEALLKTTCVGCSGVILEDIRALKSKNGGQNASI